MGYLDKRLEMSQQLINETFHTDMPVIMLIDNVNMYRGRRRHDRLVRMLGPKMWNFTFRGLFIPDLLTIEHLFKQKETAEEAQSSGKITAWDTFIGKQQSNVQYSKCK